MNDEIKNPLFGKGTEFVSRITQSLDGEFGILFVVKQGAVAAMGACAMEATNDDVKKALAIIAVKADDMGKHIGGQIDLSGMGHCFVKNKDTGQYEEKPYTGFITPDSN